MVKEVCMPKLGMTQETGTILQWFKEEGDAVEKGDLLLEVMTDKINIEVEAYDSGVLLKRYYETDAVVPVNQVIGYIGEAGESVPGVPPADGAVASNATSDAGVVAGSATDGEQSSTSITLGADAESTAIAEEPRVDAALPHARRVRATPAARALARERGVALNDVLQGGDPNRRLYHADVAKFVRADVDSAVQTAGGPMKVVQSASDQMKVEGVRKVVGQRMAQSAFTAPHVTLTTDVDMSEAIQLRLQLLPLVESQTGYRLSYTEIIVKAVACSLRHHPMMNASLTGDQIVLHSAAHVGVAVSIPNGLYVVVIRDVEHKGLTQLTREAKELADRARGGRLKPDDVSDGTFTVSNLGMYAIDAFTPIINQPESGILGVGRINDKPVGVNGRVEIRPMMTLSLSFDHRVIDGAPAAAFLTELKDVLEQPGRLML